MNIFRNYAPQVKNFKVFIIFSWSHYCSRIIRYIIFLWSHLLQAAISGKDGLCLLTYFWNPKWFYCGNVFVIAILFIILSYYKFVNILLSRVTKYHFLISVWYNISRIQFFVFLFNFKSDFYEWTKLTIIFWNNYVTDTLKVCND